MDAHRAQVPATRRGFGFGVLFSGAAGTPEGGSWYDGPPGEAAVARPRPVPRLEAQVWFGKGVSVHLGGGEAVAAGRGCVRSWQGPHGAPSRPQAILTTVL